MRTLRISEKNILLHRELGTSPLYYQIVENIETLINDSRHIGAYLPSQNQLCEIFKVSRITIRKAMEELRFRGIVLPERAKGARIIKVPEQRSRYHGIGFSSRYRNQKESISSKILEINPKCKNSTIGKILGKAESDLIVMSRVRYLSETPVACETSYLLSSSPLRAALQHFNNKSSLYEMLGNVCHWKIRRTEEQVQAVVCQNKEFRKHLNIDSTPVLFINRRTYADDVSFPVEYCESHIKSEYYGIVTCTYDR